MKLPTEIFGDVAVVHTPDELNDDQAENICLYLTSLEQHKVIVDLDGTESIDSHGLSALLDANDKLRDATGALKIATTNPINRKILEITRLDQRLDVFDSVIDAVKSFV